MFCDRNFNVAFLFLATLLQVHLLPPSLPHCFAKKKNQYMIEYKDDKIY